MKSPMPNFYETFELDFPEVQLELQSNEELLELFNTRLRLLIARDDRLELVRLKEVHLYDHYEQHFKKKIKEFSENVEAIKKRMQT